MIKSHKFKFLIAGFVLAIAGQMVIGEALAQTKPDFRISTGRQGGDWAPIGPVRRKVVKRKAMRRWVPTANDEAREAQCTGPSPWMLRFTMRSSWMSESCCFSGYVELSGQIQL